MFQSLAVLGKKLLFFVVVCIRSVLPSPTLKAARVVSCKLRYNSGVLVVFDGPWSDRPFVPDYFLVPDRSD